MSVEGKTRQANNLQHIFNGKENPFPKSFMFEAFLHKFYWVSHMKWALSDQERPGMREGLIITVLEVWTLMSYDIHLGAIPHSHFCSYHPSSSAGLIPAAWGTLTKDKPWWQLHILQSCHVLCLYSKAKGNVYAEVHTRAHEKSNQSE